MKKKGVNLLTGNVVYIIIVVAFFTILFVFAAKYSSNARAMEEATAKRIALAIDAAEPGEELSFFIDDILEKKDESYIGSVVSITDNVVRVQLSQKTGYSYAFFNAARITSQIVKKEDKTYFVVGVRDVY